LVNKKRTFFSMLARSFSTFSLYARMVSSGDLLGGGGGAAGPPACCCCWAAILAPRALMLLSVFLACGSTKLSRLPPA